VLLERKKAISETPTTVSSSSCVMIERRCKLQIGQPARRRIRMWIRSVLESAREVVSPLKVVMATTEAESRRNHVGRAEDGPGMRTATQRTGGDHQHVGRVGIEDVPYPILLHPPYQIMDCQCNITLLVFTLASRTATFLFSSAHWSRPAGRSGPWSLPFTHSVHQRRPLILLLHHTPTYFALSHRTCFPQSPTMSYTVRLTALRVAIGLGSPL